MDIVNSVLAASIIVRQVKWLKFNQMVSGELIILDITTNISAEKKFIKFCIAKIIYTNIGNNNNNDNNNAMQTHTQKKTLQ